MRKYPLGTEVWFIGHKVRPLQSTGAYATADVYVTPKVPGPPPHYHEKANELYYVLEGTMEFLRGEEWYTVTAGENFLIPKGTIHSFRNNGDTATRFLTIHDPGEGADNLFLGFSFATDEDNAFENSVSDDTIQQVLAACEANDMFLAGPEHTK
ncbi:cupin domain-containing protein [Pelagicoccus enzymogenes]|uniref:cupin domain-containing protein n=1 Tax=Pelagicoccus enzymogenes TaxID=2773457 RepID=UPI00280F7DD4|nr:cupin domain-containing protein [Pelagicoccus enzymogenes]MDQ8200370.1 cupin domain-containing protein [Pelagicoccus enzymogenes]